MAQSTSKPVSLAVRYFLVLLVLGSVCAESGYGDIKGAVIRFPRGMDPDAYKEESDENHLGHGIVRGMASVWDDCGDDTGRSGANASVACQGLRLVQNALAQWSRGPFELSSGVEIVAVAPEGGRTSRKLSDTDQSAMKGRAGLLARLRNFLENHEVRIRLPRLLPEGESWSQYLGLLYQEHAAAATTAQGRAKKDKGGGGALMMMMGMMGGMMMKMGLAATGALAMKALGVASMALMLAIAAALKKLGSKDDGGGHHVQVVPVHGGHHDHHRRRRDLHDGVDDYAQRLAFAAYSNVR